MNGTAVVAGIDGCRAGWAVATQRADGRGPRRLELVADFSVVAGRLRAGELAFAGIDIPIGLADGGPRRCDVEARRLLGPRRSSVFPAPPRAALHAGSWPEALAAARAAQGRGISLQTYHLLARIRSVDAALDPALQDRVAEVHPELAFARMAGSPLADAKRTAAGRERRRRLLGLRAVPRLAGAAADDVLDALAVLRSARLLHAGGGTRVGGDVDSRGLRMEIAY